ncbi:2-hydroxy-3-oxopropionate reductase [soil metagenome]
MAKLAFCGLGQMGLPMAANLLKAGHEMTVWNRSADKANALVEDGARAEPSPAEACREAEVVFTMLSTPEVVRDVVLGQSGVVESLGPGSTLVEMSTVGPAAARDIGSRLRDGTQMLDAPVLGSVPQATEGSLKIFVGGPRDLFERHRALLAYLGTPAYLGSLGAGAAMKVVANCTLMTLMTCLGEALALADGLGLEEEAVLEVLAGSALGATVSRKRDNISSDRFPPNFKLQLAAKDAGLVVDAARGSDVDLRLAPAAKAWLEEAVAAGLGDLDYSAVTAYERGRDIGGT